MFHSRRRSAWGRPPALLLPASCPASRRLTATLAVAVSLVAAMMLLMLPSPTMAQARKATCRSSSSARAKRSARACGRSAHRSRARAERGARRHHAKHAVKKKKKKKKRSRTAATVLTAPIQTAAICEGGTVLNRAEDGSFSCGAGSEPICESGSRPAVSSDGSTLLCDGAASTGESACEDGSSSVQGNEDLPSGTDGPLACAAGSNSVCEEGSNLLTEGREPGPICEAAAIDEGGN
jgi:hypothetical protein